MDHHQKRRYLDLNEAEIQPALSPAYEISKRLIGQLVSIRWNNLNNAQRKIFTIRKLVLGPFRSALNPLGIMPPDFVATQILKQIEFGSKLIIVTPNPITYLIMPVTELVRALYYNLMNETNE